MTRIAAAVASACIGCAGAAPGERGSGQGEPTGDGASRAAALASRCEYAGMVAASEALSRMRTASDDTDLRRIDQRIDCLAKISDGCAGFERCTHAGAHVPVHDAAPPTRETCEAHGLVLAADELPGGPRLWCRGHGPACFASAWSYGLNPLAYDAVTCRGDALDVCMNGRIEPVSCPSIIAGSTCARVDGDGDGQPSYQCMLGDRCVPPRRGAAVADRCDGDAVIVCNAGRVDRVSCRALGFAGCSDGACKP